MNLNVNNLHLDVLITRKRLSVSKTRSIKLSLMKSLEIVDQFIFSKQGLGFKRKKFSDVEISLMLCGDYKMKKLNFLHRGKDKTTDVLSFPTYDNLKFTDLSEISYLSFGDIIISMDVATKQAKRFEISLDQELIHLFIHGFLHLCGWDHEKSSEEEKLMQSLENKLVEKIFKRLKS